MNRKEYLERLEQLLLVLPYEEREEAWQYYSDYFDDAGIENEDKVILELGSPEEVAAKIRAGYAGEYGEYSEQGYEDTRFQNNQEIMAGKHNSYEGANSEWKDSVYEAEFQDEKEASQTQNRKNVNIWKVIAIVLILLIAAPIVLPLGLTGVTGVFALILTLFAVIAGVGLFGFAVLFSGIIIVASGIAKVFVAPAVGILASGIGCILLAVGTVLSLVTILVAVKVVPGIVRGIVNILKIPFRKAGAR